MTDSPAVLPALPVIGASGHAMLKQAARIRNIRVGSLLLSSVLLLVVLAPILAQYRPDQVDTNASLAPPAMGHLMGTDQYGRDVLSRLLYGGRLTITMGLVAVALGTVLGTTIGVLSGLARYTVDLIGMRVIDILMAFPSFLLALVVVAIRGPGAVTTIVAVGISLTPIFVRVARAVTLGTRQQPYVEAANAIGCEFVRIAARHVLPNVLPAIVVLATTAVGWAIVTGSALSFIGVGPQPPTPEWGVGVADGRNYLRLAWWVSTFPGLAIMVTVLAINLLGDGLRDLLDPQLRRTSGL